MFVCMYMWFRIVISGLVQIRYVYVYLEDGMVCLWEEGGRIMGINLHFQQILFSMCNVHVKPSLSRLH